MDKVLVVEMGSHATRVGWAGDEQPSQTMASPASPVDGPPSGRETIEMLQAISSNMGFEWASVRVVVVCHAHSDALPLLVLFLQRLAARALHFISQLGAALLACGRDAGIVVDCGETEARCGALCNDMGGLIPFTTASKPVSAADGPRPADVNALVENAHRQITDPQFRHDVLAFVLLVGGRANPELLAALTQTVSRGKAVVPQLKGPNTAWIGGGIIAEYLNSTVDGTYDHNWIGHKDVGVGLFESEAGRSTLRRLVELGSSYWAS